MTEDAFEPEEPLIIASGKLGKQGYTAVQLRDGIQVTVGTKTKVFERPHSFCVHDGKTRIS